MEAEFRDLLIPALQKCGAGKWGLFGAYDRFPAIKNAIKWPEINRLRELAFLIRDLRGEAGDRNELSEEFLSLCTLRKPNDPGEPKLAKAFLARVQESLE